MRLRRPGLAILDVPSSERILAVAGDIVGIDRSSRHILSNLSIQCSPDTRVPIITIFGRRSLPAPILTAALSK
jgi:hypothetical protein